MSLKTKMTVDGSSLARFAEIVAAERRRLAELAGGKDVYFTRDGFYIPDSPPRMLLPPHIAPEISMDELLVSSLDEDEYARLVYERSGRYLGTARITEEADLLDPYRFARPWIPGGVLPWER